MAVTRVKGNNVTAMGIQRGACFLDYMLNKSLLSMNHMGCQGFRFDFMYARGMCHMSFMSHLYDVDA